MSKKEPLVPLWGILFVGSCVAVLSVMPWLLDTLAHCIG